MLHFTLKCSKIRYSYFEARSNYKNKNKNINFLNVSHYLKKLIPNFWVKNI